MTDFATYDGVTAEQTSLRRGKGWRHVGTWPEFLKDGETPHPRAGLDKFETTGDLKKEGFDVRGWALSKADALAGKTLYPLNLTPAPDFDDHEEGVASSLTFNAATKEVDQVWTKPPHDDDARAQRRQDKLDEGRALLMAAIGREGPAWDAWRAKIDAENTHLRRNTKPPRDIVFEKAPSRLEII